MGAANEGDCGQHGGNCRATRDKNRQQEEGEAHLARIKRYQPGVAARQHHGEVIVRGAIKVPGKLL